MGKIQVESHSKLGIDYLKASKLIDRSPRAFMKAQDVLVAARKFRTNRGWFVSDRRKAEVMAIALRELSVALMTENFWDASFKENRVTKASLLFAYFTRFAEAFPDWRPEYQILDKTIPMIVDDITPLTWSTPPEKSGDYPR